MSVTNIYLVRHGETDYNRRRQMQGRGIDASLNKTGRKQARAIAQYVKTLDLEHIFSSSLKRSRETAQPVSELCGLEVQSHRALDEMDFGILEGRPIDEIKPELTQLHQTWSSGQVAHAVEAGESPQMVLDRAGECAGNIIREQHQSNLLFVLHGRLLRILLSHWLQYGLSQMHRIGHSNGALYHLQWDGAHFEALYLNKTAPVQKQDAKLNDYR